MRKVLLAVPALFLATFASADGYYDGYGRPLDYRGAPAYASPNAAALGPWNWNFDFGGGPAPVAGSNGDLKTGYNFTVGGGYNFTPRTGFVLEFMNAGLDVTQQAIDAHHQAIDGSASIWSVTLNPIYRFRIGGPVGAYIIGGGGFYEKEESFTEPFSAYVPGFGGGSEYVAGYTRVHDYDDTGGVNGGAGLTWNMGWGTKLFVEARYHYVFTQGKATQLVPVTIGFRW